MKIEIIIVNFRTAQLVIDCLRSIAQELRNLPETTVYVVDEFSQDHSVEFISLAIAANNWNRWAKLELSELNLGFSHGNNIALRRILSQDVQPEYVLLLNPDTRVLQNSIFELVDFLDRNPEVGIAGSQLLDPSGTPQSAAFRFPSIVSEFEQALQLSFVTRLLSRWTVTLPLADHPTYVDWVAGTSMMIRINTLKQVGLLDEDYFLYYEEVDYMRRAAKKGVQTWTIPSSQIIHIGGQSTGVINGELNDGTRPAYLLKSRYLYFCKNHGILYYWIANLSWMLGAILNLTRLIVTGKQVKRVWKDFCQFVIFSLFQSNRDIVQ